MSSPGEYLLNNPQIICYHANCPDGFCAAFVAKKKYPDAELIPCYYGGPVPDVNWKDVLVVDFSWPRQQVLEMASRARSLVIFDHHLSAQKELVGLPYAVFDMDRSGATLTWDILFGPAEKRPWYVNYVEDRDLWRWKLADSPAVSAYLMALPQTIEAWNQLDSIYSSDAAVYGKAIRLHIDHYIEKVVAQRQVGNFQDHPTLVVNAAYPNISDVCDALLTLRNGDGIALGWFERGDGRIQFSLRSRGDLDVSAIAKRYGGGGHKNAAGFELSVQEGRDLVDSILGRVVVV